MKRSPSLAVPEITYTAVPDNPVDGPFPKKNSWIVCSVQAPVISENVMQRPKLLMLIYGELKAPVVKSSRCG